MALQAAIAGTGFIGRVHARSLRLAGAELAGVAASSPESAAAAAAKLGAGRAFDSAEELVGDPDIDVVHICAPNHLHLPLAEAALWAGKHVICEKPLATDTAGARRLVDAASGSGLHAAVPFVYRYYPTVREARERVRSGRTGALHLLHGTYLQDWLLRADDTNWRVDDKLGGASRAFADIGSHWCDLAEFVSGHRITRLSARLVTAVPERVGEPGRRAFEAAGGEGDGRPVTTEDAALVQFETDSGAVGSLVVSQVSAGRKNRLSWEIDGSEAAMAWHSEAPEELWIGQRGRPNELLLSEGGDYPPAHAEGFPDTFKHLYRAVYRAVAAGEPPAEPDYPTFADGHEEALIADAIARSHAEQRWVTVNPVPQEVR